MAKTIIEKKIFQDDRPVIGDDGKASVFAVATSLAAIRYATLEELCEQMKKKARVEVSVPMVFRALQALGLSGKKRLSERQRPIR